MKYIQILTGFLRSRHARQEIAPRVLGPEEETTRGPKSASLSDPFFEGDLGILGALGLLDVLLGLLGALGIPRMGGLERIVKYARVAGVTGGRIGVMGGRMASGTEISEQQSERCTLRKVE